MAFSTKLTKIDIVTSPTNPRTAARKFEAECRTIFQSTPRFQFCVKVESGLSTVNGLCIIFDDDVNAMEIDDMRYFALKKFCEDNSSGLCGIEHLEITTSMSKVPCKHGSNDVYLFNITDILSCLFSTGMLLKTFEIKIDGYVRILACDMDCCIFSGTFHAQYHLESFRFHGTLKPTTGRSNFYRNGANLYRNGFDALLENIVNNWLPCDPTREQKFIIVSNNFFHFTSINAIAMLCSGSWNGSISVNFLKTGYKSLRRFSRGVEISNNNGCKNLILTYVHCKSTLWERILNAESPFKRVDIHRNDSERVPIWKMVNMWKAIIDGPATAVSLNVLVAPIELNPAEVSIVLGLLWHLRDNNFHLVDFYPGFAPNFLDGYRPDFLDQFSFYANLNKAKRSQLIPRNDTPLQESYVLNVILNLAEMRESPYRHDHSCLTSTDVNCVPAFYNVPSVAEFYHVVNHNPQILLSDVKMEINRKRKHASKW